MKPFNLEAAKRGDPCMFRDGTPVKFVAHVPEATEGQRVIILSSDGCIFVRSEFGRYLFNRNEEHPADIVMAPKKKTVWINIYDGYSKCQCFETREMAEDAAYLSELGRIGNKAWPLEIEE